MYTFAHLADAHIGAFRHPALQLLALKALNATIDACVDKKVDFVLISGDLFDSNIPDMALANAAVKKLREAQEQGIPLYVVYGSHDFSPTQSSIVDLLESSGLFKKVTKGKTIDNKLQLEFEIDQRTGAKLCGISGRRLGIDRAYYEILDRQKLEKEDGFKIFAFHGALSEYKPKYMAEADSMPISLLPKGFNYYAGGHVHEKTSDSSHGYNITYPGTLFGADYRDLERSASGEERGFYIIHFSTKVERTDFIPISVCDYDSEEYDANNKSATKVEEDLLQLVREKKNLTGRLVLLKVSGEMATGKSADIDFQKVKKLLKENGAIEVQLNYQKLTSKQYAAIHVASLGEESQKIEERLFKEHVGTVKVENQKLKGETGVALSKELLSILKQAMKENETKKDYEKRIVSDAAKTLGLQEAIS
ncbi:MAG: metallophosphoesterase [Candidatus Bathyarchaeia archaeon]